MAASSLRFVTRSAIALPIAEDVRLSPPALAHRLDRETSGCLVLGRHRKALAHLGLLFKHGRIGKTYWAVVEDGPQEDAGRIDLALGRLDAARGWWMKPDAGGQPAVT